jgi:hypothetical protein
MRTARPVGLSQDGQFLIVETGDGDQISVPADADLRQLLRNRPRPHLETGMEHAMTPREIQMRIRAGASVEEIAESSGMPIARVEAFAAPVIAERNHIAGLAQVGSVRRTGEPTGHRTLRAAVGDRLKERGVNPDSVEWDSFKMDDGRWSISARYRLEQADRVAVFYFDQRGRFSVSGNDEARWSIGEPAVEADAGSSRTSRTHIEDVDTEPTLKLAGPAEELALLRAVETDDYATHPQPEPEVNLEPEAEPEAQLEAEVPDDSADEYGTGPDLVAVPEEAPAEPNGSSADEPSQLDLLYDLLGHDGYAEDSIRVFEGLSDATAVPEVANNAWQDAADEESYPAEPSAEDAEPTSKPDDAAGSAPEPEIFADGATQEALPGAHHEPVENGAADAASDASSDDSAAEAQEAPEPKPAARSRKRKRASVPSWDEIMFGSPKSK